MQPKILYITNHKYHNLIPVFRLEKNIVNFHRHKQIKIPIFTEKLSFNCWYLRFLIYKLNKNIKFCTKNSMNME